MDEQWQQCVEHFFEHAHRQSGSKNTLRQYRWTLARLFTMFPGKSPEQITRADVEHFLSTTYGYGRVGRSGPSTSTRNQRLAIIKSFYVYAAGYDVERDGKMVPLMQGRAPTHNLHAGKAPKIYRAMSGEEVRRFFGAIPNTPIGKRDRALFLCYFYTARRRCEILNLKWGDISEGAVVDSRGMTRRGHTYRFHNKGSHQEETETFELPEPAYEAICAYLKACNRWESIRPEDYIFVTFDMRGDLPVAARPHRISDDRTRVIMKQYAQAAGLDVRKLTLHSFRHTSARERYQRGSGVLEIKQLLRHASLDTTYNYLEALTSTADPGAMLLEHAFSDL